MPLNTIAIQAYEEIEKQSPFYTEQMRGSGNTANIILTGLAQTCFNAGQIITASNPEEKKQGIFNGLGALFNTIGALAKDREDRKKTKQAHITAEETIASLSQLFNALDAEFSIEKNPSLIKTLKLRKYSSANERSIHIDQALRTPSKHYRVAGKILNAASGFACKNNDAILLAIEMVVSKILDKWITNYFSEQPKPLSPVDISQGTIIYCVSADEQKNTDVVDEATKTITTRVWRKCHDIIVSSQNEKD